MTTDIVPIKTGEDVVRVRQKVRVRATEAGLSLVDQTKLITAASELARNTLDYGKGGEARIETLATPGNGVGHGLGGARRLVDDFDIQTAVGKGTTVTIARWKR